MINRYKFETNLLTIVLMLSSIIGLKLFGISVNKIALILLEIYLIFATKKKMNIGQGKKILLVWYLFSIVSCVYGILVGPGEKIIGFESSLLLYVIQSVVIYIPCIILSNNMIDRKKSFVEAIVFVAKVHCVWSLIQFISWYGFKLDFNDFVFNSIFKGFFGSDWSAWNYEKGSLALRVAGLNRDSAFFTIILILGFSATTSKVWKAFFVLGCLLSMSRSGIVGIFIVLMAETLPAIRRKTSLDSLKRFLIFFGIATTIGIVLYISIPSIRYQLQYTLFRFSSITENRDPGTNRHIVYLLGSLKSWAMEYNIFQKFFGVGPRCGGVGLQMSNSVVDIIGYSFSAWSIESDYCEILLGHGIFGYISFMLYFFILFRGNKADRNVVLALFVMSILYNYFELTLVQIWLFCCLDFKGARNGRKNCYNIGKL